MEFIGSAYRIYPPDANATFADSLVEKGYLTGEQAEKIPEEGTRAKSSELQSLLPQMPRNEPAKSSTLPLAAPDKP